MNGHEAGSSIHDAIIDKPLPPLTLPRLPPPAPRTSSQSSGVSQEQLDTIAAEAVAACAADPPRPALLAYLVARKRLIALLEQQQQQQQQDSAGSAAGASSSVIVEFSRVDSGKAEAVVRARRPGEGDAPFVSGLEASAEGGEGAGIERFRPVKRGVQLSPRMSLPAEAAARMNALKAAKRAEAALTARGGGAGAGR